jgi:hypothetical protein
MAASKKVYLVAKYYASPRKKHATAIAGYMKDPKNIQWDEQVEITVGLKNKDINTARIILNISDQVVHKNGFSVGKPFEELFQYYYNANPQQISEALRKCGMSISQKEPAENGATEDIVSTDVQTEEETGSGSQRTTATQPTVTG